MPPKGIHPEGIHRNINIHENNSLRNGKSRLKWDLKQNLHDDIITWGCNRIYNDTVVDNLVAVDYWVQHLVYESGYALNNKCWFGDWNILPSDFDIEHMREGWNKVTENTKKDYGCVVNGRNDELHKGLYITWIDEMIWLREWIFPKSGVLEHYRQYTLRVNKVQQRFI